MSDNAQQQDATAPNADPQPPPHNTAGETVGEAVTVPTLTSPPPRREEAATSGKKKPRKPKTTEKQNDDSKEKRDGSKNRPSRDASKKRESRDNSKVRPSGPARDKSASGKGPSGPKTPPEKPPTAPSAPTGSSEPTRKSLPKGYRIPKIKDARPVRSEKEEEAARNREKSLNSKNYTKKILLPHYVKGSHPLNPEEADNWSDSRHPSERSAERRSSRGGLVSSYVAFGPNAEKYKPRPNGPSGSTSTKKPSDDKQSHKRSHASTPSDSDVEVIEPTPQEQRDRRNRGTRSRQADSSSPSGQSSGHRSRADSGHRPSGLTAPQHHTSRNRSALRNEKSLPPSMAGKSNQYLLLSGLIPPTTSSEAPPSDRASSTASRVSRKSGKQMCVRKPVPDFQHPLGQIVVRKDDEASASNQPTPTVKRSMRQPRLKPYAPIVDANIRKDNILQTRDAFKKLGKPCPINWDWYHMFNKSNVDHNFEFAISHFVHPASIVPLNILPIRPGELPPTIQQCAAENELYPNEFIYGIIQGCHPAVAFLASPTVLAVLRGHRAVSSVPDYTSVGIFTGLDFGTASSEAYPPWRADAFKMYTDQTKTFEAFVQIALDFDKVGLRRPLCLTLRNSKKSIYRAVEDALEILRMKEVPNTFPIFLTNWSGTPRQAWTWLRAYPNTIFGLTYDYVITKTDAETEQFLHELPFANMVLESGCPKRRCDNNFATSVTCMETACLLHQITGEAHRHILEQTAWTSLQFFFPGTPRPAMWSNTESTQDPRRFVSIGEKLLVLDYAAEAGQQALADVRRAGGLPSISAEQLRKKIAEEQFNKNNKSILDNMPDEEDCIFNDFMMDFSPNTESFQEMDIRKERAASSSHLAAQDAASPAPLNYDNAASAAAVLAEAKQLASRLVIPKGKTAAEKEADGAKAAAAIQRAEKEKAKGFSRKPDSVVLEYPEFNDDWWDVDESPRPFPLADPVNTHRWSILVPGPRRTYWEPLDDCRDHDVKNNPHLRIYEAVPSYKIICKEKGKRGPERAQAIGRLHVDSHGKMFAILWAARHHMKPKKNPADKSEPQRANEVVLDFINSVARSRSSDLPELVNRYYDAIRDEHMDDPFTEYDFKTAIMRWYDGCPNASAFYNDHATGPISWQPRFLDLCRQDIREAYLRVALPYFRRAMDWTRMRLYQVKMGFSRPWTPPAYDVPRTLKDQLVKVKFEASYILNNEQIMFVDSWGLQFTGRLRPNVEVIRLSDINSEAIEEAQKYFMGHLVRKVYWFHGASAFSLRSDGYLRSVTNVSQHFSRTFPHTRFYFVLAPFTADQQRAWHDQLHSNVTRVRADVQNVTLIMHPTDIDLCTHFDACEMMRLVRPDWPTSEHTEEGHLSSEGLHRRKEFMEVHYEVELWLQREHDPDAEREEQAAAQELVEELGAMGEHTRLPDDDQSSQDLEEPSGSFPNEDEDADLGEPSGSKQPSKEPYVHYWAATAHVTPKEPSEELREFYNKTFNTTTGRKPHYYDYLQAPQPPKAKPKMTVKDFMEKAAKDARARKLKPAESSASSSNQDYRQAEEHPSRPSTTDTVSDLSDAPLPLQLPSIGPPSGAACANLVLQSATTLEQLLARMNADSSGDYTRRVFAHLKQANLLEPSGSQQQQSPGQTSSLLERLQLTRSDLTTDQTEPTTEPTTPLPTDESPPSKQTHDSEVSSDTIDQAAPPTASDDSLDESTEEDEDGSLSETDDESHHSDEDPYSGPSHGNDWY